MNCQFLNCHMELICAFQLYNLTLQHKSKNLHYFLQFHSKTNYLSCALLLKVKLLKRFNPIYFLALFCSIKVFKAYTWRCAIFKCVIFAGHKNNKFLYKFYIFIERVQSTFQLLALFVHLAFSRYDIIINYLWRILLIMIVYL